MRSGSIEPCLSGCIPSLPPVACWAPVPMCGSHGYRRTSSRHDLPFPRSLLEFRRLFPDEEAYVAYLERARCSDGFICDYCSSSGETYRFANRPGVLWFRHCNRDTSLTAGAVMERNALAGLVFTALPGGLLLAASGVFPAAEHQAHVQCSADNNYPPPRTILRTQAYRPDIRVNE